MATFKPTINDLGDWFETGLDAELKCTYIEPEDHVEKGVTFKVGGRTYSTWAQPHMLNEENKTLLVTVVARYEDGSYLIYLPVDTLSSGIGLKVAQDAPELVIHDPQQ